MLYWNQKLVVTMATLLCHLCEKTYLNKSTKTFLAFLVSSFWLLYNRQHAWILTLRLVSQNDHRGKVIFLILKMFYFLSLHIFYDFKYMTDGTTFICCFLHHSLVLLWLWWACIDTDSLLGGVEVHTHFHTHKLFLRWPLMWQSLCENVLTEGEWMRRGERG